MIIAKNLKKSYLVGHVKVEAIKDVSMEIKRGEFVAIFGQSGSGKSTLLNMLGLLDKPTFGTIYLDGKNVSNLSEDQKNIIRLKKFGFVFQEYNIIPEMTALENTMLPALMTDAKMSYIRRKAEYLLRYLGLGKRINHVPAELSGGEKQRVSIARSLMNNPEVMFADEPTANLDTANADIIIKMFKKLSLDLKLTVVLVTHNYNYLRYANRIVHLQDGYVKSTHSSITSHSMHASILKNVETYVKKGLEKNIPKHKIRENLMRAGWREKDLEKIKLLK